MRFLDEPSAPRRAREAFDRAGYTLDAVTARLGPHAFNHLAAGERAPLVRATRGGDPLDVLVRLFLVGGPVDVVAARSVLAPLPLEGWAAGGLVVVDGDAAAGTVVIRPLGDPAESLVVHDRPAGAGAVPADHVLGVSASTVGLAGATIRRPVDAALDLGTGCGVQAVHAAAHSRRVVASDLNRRAVACATLTMELNGLAGVEVRSGDLFGAAPGERFDLIVANPPFVISPSRRYLFRDAGRPVDGLSRTIVEGAPAHLEAGGHCQLLASWAHVDGEDWRERLAGWFAGSGCDALVLQREAADPAAHAASWLRQTEQPEQWDEFDGWLDYYAAHRVEAIGFGLITMRKRADDRPGWFRAEDAAQDLAMPCGDHLGAVFELADFLDGHDDDALAGVAFAVAPGVVLDERLTPEGPGWRARTRRLRQTAGLGNEGDVDPVVAALVGACDGRRPLRDVLVEAADGSATSVETLAAAALPIIRRLVEQGFLLPTPP